MLRLDPKKVVKNANDNLHHLDEISIRAKQIWKYTADAKKRVLDKEDFVKELRASSKCASCKQKADEFITCLCFDSDRGHSVQICKACYTEKKMLWQKCDLVVPSARL
eukprot:scaffold253047_cov83-Attheya_sp.AAC.1